ncbi:hypothetical protein WJX79_005614 [Trebouxia sp. C0005]
MRPKLIILHHTGNPAADGDERMGDQGTSGHDAGDDICQDGLDRHAQKGAKAAKDQEAAKKAVETAEEVAKVAAEGGTQPPEGHDMSKTNGSCLRSCAHHGAASSYDLEGPQQDNQVAKVDVKTIHKGGAFKSAKAHACSRLAHGSTVTGDHRTSALHQACFMMLGGVVRSICIGIAIA